MKKLFLLLLTAFVITIGCKKDYKEPAAEPSTTPTEGKYFLTKARPLVINQREGEVCYDVFSVAYENGVLVSETYLYSFCNDGGGAHGGGGAGGPKITFIESHAPCARNFSFTMVTPYDLNDPLYEGGWQEAAISGIYFNYVDTRNGVTRTVSFGTIYFGIPYLRIDGTFYSSNEAAVNAAAAANYAEYMTFRYLKNNPYASVASLQSYYLRTLNQYMVSNFAGAAKKTPSVGFNGAILPYKPC